MSEPVLDPKALEAAEQAAFDKLTATCSRRNLENGYSLDAPSVRTDIAEKTSRAAITAYLKALQPATSGDLRERAEQVAFDELTAALGRDAYYITPQDRAASATRIVDVILTLVHPSSGSLPRVDKEKK